MKDEEKIKLTHHIDRFILLEDYHLSMAMVIDIMNCLSKSFNVKKSTVFEIWKERAELIDKKKSSVYFEIEYK